MAKVNVHCQLWTCFGLDEYNGLNRQDEGYISVSIEYSFLLNNHLKNAFKGNSFAYVIKT